MTVNELIACLQGMVAADPDVGDMPVLVPLDTEEGDWGHPHPCVFEDEVLL